MVLSFGVFAVFFLSTQRFCDARPGAGQGALTDLDTGYQFAFANVQSRDGFTYTGQIVGVYNEKRFMWHPSNYSTLSLFTSTYPNAKLNQFSTTPGEDPAIFSLSSENIESIQVIAKPSDMVEYEHYMRRQDYVIQRVPMDGETYITEAWTTYHQWEDGRGSYAWDLAKLNTNMMTYSHFGTRLTDFEVFGEQVYLPMAGTVVTVHRREVDNDPDLTTAVDLMDVASGTDVDLEEKPQNMIELEIGGRGSPGLLRMIHFKQDTVSSNIQVGSHYEVGTAVGEAGNSGTTYVPHVHMVFGFTDRSGRFWALPIEWKNVAHRILLPYPRGYEYGQSHVHAYLYPKLGYCLAQQ